MEFDTEEIQSDDHAAIAPRGGYLRRVGRASLREGSRLFIDALGSFPGPYSSYVYGTLGIERVAALARREDDVRARFQSVLAYRDGDGTHTFERVVIGPHRRMRTDIWRVGSCETPIPLARHTASSA